MIHPIPTSELLNRPAWEDIDSVANEIAERIVKLHEDLILQYPQFLHYAEEYPEFSSSCSEPTPQSPNATPQQWEETIEFIEELMKKVKETESSETISSPLFADFWFLT
jgi:hypothetical protein